MSYKKRLRTVAFMFNGEPFEIADTVNSMDGTEAYEQFMRGGIITHKLSDTEGVVVNTSVLDALQYYDAYVDVDEVRDVYCKEFVKITITNNSDYGVTVHTFGCDREAKSCETITLEGAIGDTCYIFAPSQETFTHMSADSEQYTITASTPGQGENMWSFEITGGGECTIENSNIE